ncbi:DNA polymerase III subunit gamma and tau [Marinactinospora rubrisoli]|uniref:DNA polymerase III subunit gamma/tau n=1 Tax=Marinactinospora rubrisoli TaxID=2715399 RepID=A0ABW2KDJ7_9ACTN
MSIALYRKYRPATFAEVRGQEHVTEPLRQALRNGRINHAYLFSGPRGCGKTSSARILARSLNCEKGPTPDPCGVCDSCVALAPDGAGSIDVIEIDAASHGGVDDARDLRERAFFAPVNSRYKVYIIDEAHMVTREGFNALLKLVEEPPPHLKFVFATTEPEKVIGTIRSRTHHYPFRLIPPSTLRELMEQILTEEKVPFDPAALPLVVRAGAGSARDSLSILDQLLAGSDEHGITREGAVALLGYTDSGLLSEMIDALGARDGAAVFGLIDRVVEGGHDPRRFTADLLERTRDLVVLAAVPDALDKGLINVPPDAVEHMREQAERLGPATLTRAADILNSGLTEMRGATAPRLLLELLCARVLLPGTDTAGEGPAMLARLEQLERRVAAGPVAAPQPPVPRHAPAVPAADVPPAPDPGPPPRPADPAPPPVRRPDPEPRPGPAADDWPDAARPGQAGAGSAPRPEPQPSAPQPAAAPAGGGRAEAGAIHAAWPQVLEAVKRRRRFTWMILTGNDVQVVGMDGATVQLGFARANDAKGFSNSGSDQVVQAAIQQVLGVEVRVAAVARNGATPPAPQRPASPPSEPSGWAESPRPADSRSAATRAEPAEPPRDDSGPQRPAAPPPPAHGDSRSPHPAPPPEPEPDVPDPENDLDADDAPAPSGFSLIESELGGKIIEEIDHNG